MNKYMVLTKVLLKSGIGDVKKREERTWKKSWKKYALAVLIFTCMMPTVIMIATLSMYMYDTLATIGQEGYFIAIAFNALCIVNMIFGILSCINVFYFSKDLSNLLSLPLSAWQIIAAKFTTVLMYNYITQIIIILPLMIGYGIAASAGIMYWAYSLIIFFMLPIVPLIYSSLIVMILMGFTKFMKNKERFAIYSGVAVLVFAMGISVVSQKLAQAGGNPNAILALANAGNNSLVNLLFVLFPSGRFATDAIINYGNMSGLFSCLIFIGISIAFVIAFVMFSEKLYFKGVIGITETTTKRKKLTSNQIKVRMKKSPTIWIYTLKELKLLFRTPIYFMNCIVLNFIFPLLFLLPLLLEKDFAKNLEMLNTLINTQNFTGIILVAGISIVGFITSSTGIAATAISREGSNIFFMKYIPMPYADQLKAKILSSVLMGMVAMCTTLIVILVMLNIPLYLIIALIELSMLMILFVTLLGLMIDLKIPKLNWDSEQKAVKQNLNIFFQMGIVVLILIAIIAIGIYFNMSVLNIFLSINVILGIVCFALYKLIMSKGIRCLERL